MSLCVILSRITGFIRTWALAFALGASFLSSSYQIANALPEMLYELVIGGMLATAFLPVYVSVKERLGEAASADFASNLFTIVMILLATISALGMIFPQVVIYTQSYYSDQASMGNAVMFFRFFAIQMLFYGGSSIFSGLLNAHRHYIASYLAPVFNNLVVITAFFLYAALAPAYPQQALYIIAIGNPLGVVAQMVIQIPAMRRCGIRLRPRLDLHDKNLKAVVRLGVAALIVMVFNFITTSVMNSASYAFADNGPSIIAYARLWYTLPYSLIAVPISTELFTELSLLRAGNKTSDFISMFNRGTRQIMFLLICFAAYLIAFAHPLATIYHIGSVEAESVDRIASYLQALSLALPPFSLLALITKTFSSMQRMGIYALFNGLASLIQVVLTSGLVAAYEGGVPVTMEGIALISALFFMITDACSLIYLKHRLGHIGARSIIRACIYGTILGSLGAAAGACCVAALSTFVASYEGSITIALIYTLIGGTVALAITFGIAQRVCPEEASHLISMASALFRR